jgi:predicted metal-dependent phosphoesterase TrpH
MVDGRWLMDRQLGACPNHQPSTINHQPSTTMIDLHAHTTASDGSLTPTELVALARDTGLSALGVTDHDTVGGLPEATAAARAAGLELVPGVELSVDYPHGQFHLLGYFVDFTSRALLDRLQYLQDYRFRRNEKMVELMQQHGLPITMEDLAREAGGKVIGRPHMALALVRKGVVGSTQEAFDRYLADGKPCHLPKVKLLPAEAIALLHSAGAVTVLAHPKFLRIEDPGALCVELASLKELGLDGIEVYYSQHTESETALYLEMARELGFEISGGSDFHGRSKPTVKLGVVYQGTGVPEEVLAGLKAVRRSEARRPMVDS